MTSPDPKQNRPALTPALRIAAIYGAVGVLWILLSDKLATQITSSPAQLHAIETLKGIVFIALTTLLLHRLVARAMGDLEASRAAAAESENHLHQLVDGFDEYAIITVSPDGLITSWNPGAAKLTGYEAREIVGRPLSLLHTDAGSGTEEAARALAVAAGQGHFGEEGLRRRKNGSLFTASIAIRPLFDGNGALKGFSSIFQDITERKNAENKISHLNRLYALLSRVNMTIVRTREQQALFDDICRAVVEEGLFIMAWIGLVDPGGQRVLPAAWHGTVDGYLDNLSIILDDSPLGQGPIGTVMKTGRSFICNDIQHNPYMAPWRDAALARGYRSMAAFPIRTDGTLLGALTIYSTEVFFFDADEVLLLDEVADDISFALHSIEEESQRRRAEEELQRLNSELEQRVRQRTAELELANQELESFNYSVSHDLRSPLTVINGFSQTLLEDCNSCLSDRGRFYVERIKLATNRMAKLIDDLLTLTRVNRKPLTKQTFDLSNLAESVAHDLQTRHGQHHPVTFSATPGLEVCGDPGLIRIALMNLLGNAWKYTAPKPEATVEFGRAEKGGQACFYIRDNGVGFDMTYADKLFKPFERLHSLEDFDGSGIGLATVKRILNRHGGAVWAEASPDGGATFYFTF